MSSDYRGYLRQWSLVCDEQLPSPVNFDILGIDSTAFSADCNQIVPERMIRGSHAWTDESGKF